MAVFPLSLARVKKIWDGTQNPLDLLTPSEVRAAEIWASLAFDPQSGKKGTFHARFRETFGFDLPGKTKQSMLKNPAWKAYVRQLLEETRATVMTKLETSAMKAFEDYIWSREEARKAADYKEVRLGAADHLDRIGATRRVAGPAAGNSVTIVLKGAPEVTHATIMRQLPAVEAEIEEEDASPN